MAQMSTDLFGAGCARLHAASRGSRRARVGPSSAEQRLRGRLLGASAVGAVRGAPGGLCRRNLKGKSGQGRGQGRVASMHCRFHCWRGKGAHPHTPVPSAISCLRQASFPAVKPA